MRAAVAALALACASGTPSGPGEPDAGVSDADARAFSRRIESFYGALRGRPLDVYVTYDDPELRAYFATPREFSDWFASVANQVRASDLRHSRPEEVRIREFRFEGPDTARVGIVMVGRHEQPLRLRDVEVERTDVWRRSGGTWLLTPDRL
jgi:hypothetical protein